MFIVLWSRWLTRSVGYYYGYILSISVRYDSVPGMCHGELFLFSTRHFQDTRNADR